MTLAASEAEEVEIGGWVIGAEEEPLDVDAEPKQPREAG